MKKSICPRCVGSDGMKKVSYTNISDAQNYINSISVRVDYPLAAYNCPHGNGVHLTKNVHLKPGQQVGLVFQEPPEVRNVLGLNNKLKILTELAIKKHQLEKAELAKIQELLPGAGSGYYICPKCSHEWSFYDIRESICECGDKGPFNVKGRNVS